MSEVYNVFNCKHNDILTANMLNDKSMIYL